MHGKKKLDSRASMNLESHFHLNLVVMASKVDAPPHWIFAGPVGLFYVDNFVDNFVDCDWAFTFQLTFWVLMLALVLYMVDADP